MKKASIRILKIMLWITLPLLILTITAYFVLQSTAVQTFLVKKTGDYLADKLHTKINIQGVDFAFFDQLILRGVYIEDLHHDTLLYAGNLKINIWKFRQEENRLRVRGCTLENVRFNLVQYKGEKDLNLQFLIDAFDSGDTTKTPSQNFEITGDRITLRNVDFSYDFMDDTSQFYGVNFDHIRLKNINGDFSSFHLNGDTIKSRIDNLSFREKSGFTVNKLQTVFRISPIGMDCEKLKLETRDSRLDCHLSFTTSSYDDYDDFEEKVIMKGDFRKSHLEMHDISYFTSELKDIQFPLLFSGIIKGPVANLKGNDMDIFFASHSRLRGNIKMNGLPNFDETFIQLKIKSLESNIADIQTIPLPPFSDKECIKLPKNFYKLGKITFSGDFTGFPNDFTAYGDFTTGLGSVSSDIEMKPQRNGISSYKGKISANNFNLGYFYGIQNILTYVTLDTHIEGKGLSNETVSADISGNVKELSCFGYNYKNISLAGHFAKNIFNGSFDILDPNLELHYNGDIDVTGKLPRFDFSANVKNANLYRLHILKNAYDMSLSAETEFNFTGDDIDNIVGSIKTRNINYRDSSVTLHFNKANLIASFLEKEKFKSLIIDSDPLNAKISGNFLLQELGTSFEHLVQYYLPSMKPENKAELAPQLFQFQIKIHDSGSLSELLTRHYSIRNRTEINGTINTLQNTYELNITAPSVGIYGKDLLGVNLRSKSIEDKLIFDFTGNSFELDDTNRIKPINLTASARHDSVYFNLTLQTEGLMKNSSLLDGFLLFHSGRTIDLHLNPQSVITLEDSSWNFSPANLMHIHAGEYDFQEFTLSHNQQAVSLQTIKSTGKGSKLLVNMRHFYLETLNPLLRQQDIEITGIINGNAEFSYIDNNLIFTTNTGFKDFSFNREKLGDGSIIAIWDSKKENIAINGTLMRGQLPVISFTGFYSPQKSNSLDFKIQLKKLQVKLFEKYVTGIFSNMNGFASGDLFLQGSFKKPVLQGEIEVQRGMAKVDYLNTNYVYNGKVVFSENNIRLKDIEMSDENGKNATLEGEFTHEYFDKIKLNLEISANQFLFLNTTESQNALYYGKAVGSGIVRFSGNLDKIVIDVAAKTEKGTVFNIPLSNPEEIGESGFVRFVNKDSTQLKIRQAYKVDLSGIEMMLDLEVTPDAEVNMIFDSKVGDIITGNGSGNLKLAINTVGDFNMFGNYTISKGSYLFTLKNVINKKFKISEGGSINWSGDPFGADINLEAVYTVKTSLYDIVQSDSSKKRVPVNCILKMTDKLMTPTIKFDITLPQSDEKIQNDVRSAINMDNEAELNKQIFSLLMLGRFFPPNDRPAASSLGLSQNTSELISSQISNWLSQSNEFVDLSVKYQASDQVSSQEWQVAARTQLFNERLSIDGNVGMANANSSASNIVGDVNIEYKVTADGKLRLKAYTQSNDYSNLTRIAPYTQGVGVFYREDFDSFDELMKMYSDKIRFYKNNRNNTSKSAD